MELQWILVVHGLVTATVVVSLLCGHWPIFQGTFIERIHSFITFGAYHYLLRFVTAVFGTRGRNAVLTVEHYCCDRPNPILQLMYLAIVGGTYYAVAESSFKYIPSYYIGEYHWYASFLAVGGGFLIFLLASYSDPGTVTAENVSQYISAYPYDGMIFTEKECPTCKLPKPARSKHCGICGRCVSRFDHHCGWMNNCIGEKNTRYFIGFLLWHFLLCIYGAVGLSLVLAGQIKEKRIVFILTAYYGVENSFSSLWPHIVQWLVAIHNTQILLIAFLGVISLLLAGFFGYHAHLCLSNTTTNETFKWEEYLSWMRKLKEAKASAASLKATIQGIDESTTTTQTKKRRWWSFFRDSSVEEEAVKNPYDKGSMRNVLEVLFPLSERSSFFKGKSE